MLLAITTFDKFSLGMAAVAALIGIMGMLMIMRSSFTQKSDKH
ncbi:MAG: hypothetical protein ACI82G_001136 [Bradymonadia bacterium]|jgi:hypothetical protein